MLRPIASTTALRLAALLLACAPHPSGATTYYVRQTTGDDARDGTSAATAWRHVGKLSSAMHAGDTAYVGPGLYREEIVVEHDGAADARIVFVADTTGQHTGDPPGVVILTGADPMDGAVFTSAGFARSLRGADAGEGVGCRRRDGRAAVSRRRHGGDEGARDRPAPGA